MRKIKSDVKREIPVLAYNQLLKCLETDPPIKFKGYDYQNFIFILDSLQRLEFENPKAKKTKDGKIRIPSKLLRSYITYRYANYIRWLKKHNLIECDYIKCQGKAYAYSLPLNLQSDLETVYISKDSIIGKRIVFLHKKRINKGISHKKKNLEQEEKNKILQEEFKNIEVDLDGGVAELKNDLENKTINWNQYHSGVLSLKALSEGVIFFKISNKNGRLNTNLTNLPSNLRKYVFKNAEMIHIDCKNSQPYMVNVITDLLLQNKIYSTELKSKFPSTIHPFPLLGDAITSIIQKRLSVQEINYLNKFPLNNKVIKEFEKFRYATTADDFYLDMAKEFENNTEQKTSRTDMKTLMFMVMFSQNYMFRKEKSIFRSLYPNIYKIIYNLKRKKHNTFALLLQNIESYIFIECICKNLIDAGIVPFTIHDSVIVQEKDKNRTMEIMRQTCEFFTTVAPELIVSEL